MKKFPDLEVTALLRSPSAEFKERYPSVKTVKGTFDDFDTIESAAEKADIVIRTSDKKSWLCSLTFSRKIAKPSPDTGDIDHPGCANALLSGMKKKDTPGFLIHLTGTGCISDEREQSWKGDYNPHKWNDLTEIKEIYDLPDEAQHHKIDKDMMDASQGLLKTCIICPPDIFGQNTGTGARATFLVPEYVKVLLNTKEAFYLGKGENMRAVTHIDDVVDLFIILLDNAIQGGGKAQWGREVSHPSCTRRRYSY